MSNKTIEKRMKKVIDYVMTNALEYETFTGAMLMKDDEIIYKEMTSISKDHNPLAHAELKVIQRAIEKYGNDLSSFQLYTTQKPCMMCASAIVWSGIQEVFYGVNSNHHWRYDNDIHDFFANHNVVCFGPILEDECQKIDQYLISNGI